MIAKLRDTAHVPVWLVGTSIGRVSAANAAARLKVGGPDGLVLTLTVTKEARQVTETVNDVGLKDIGVPTLVVHHKQDSCVATPHELARSLMRSLTQAPKKELLSFEEGTPSVLGPCESMSHRGFLGLDGKVVTAIVSRIKQSRSFRKLTKQDTNLNALFFSSCRRRKGRRVICGIARLTGCF